MMTLIKHIMTQNIVSVPFKTTLFDAHHIMKEKRIRHLPITDGNGGVVGIISQRDLNCIPDSKHLTVGMMMSTYIESVDYNTPLRQAILTMLEKKISSLLVCDTAETIVGIVTTDDILWHQVHMLSHEAHIEHYPPSLASLPAATRFTNGNAVIGI